MAPDLMLHGMYILVTLAASVISYVVAKRNPKPANPNDPAPVDPSPISIPDLIPGRPIVNAILKMAISKLLAGSPLLAGESELLKMFSGTLAALEPELRTLLDQLGKPATPAPAK